MAKVSCGELIETPSLKVFFGNRHSTFDNLKKEFPDLELLKVKQTHSDRVVPATSFEEQSQGNLTEADAHYTQEAKKALLVSTADCLPVLIHLPTSQLVMGIHAGWRGIEFNIIGKSIAHLKLRGHDISDAQVWIGPHIGFKSFEVGLDVAARLRKAYEFLPSVDYGEFEHPQPDPQKKRVNLFLIAVLQLISQGVHEQNINSLFIDTFTSEEHESFRRDGPKATRQLSFIALK